MTPETVEPAVDAAIDAAQQVNEPSTAEPSASESSTAEARPAAVAVTTGKLCAAELIRAFEAEQLKSELPDIYVGDTVKVERRGKVRRAKLFYLRDRVGKATRVKQRFDR